MRRRLGSAKQARSKGLITYYFRVGNHRAEPFLPALIRLHRPCTPPPARTQ
ncbi:hypothetical protein TIFTF001_054365 [Ficus carica]|nr:hypothetical protein TIFTF001_054363 [Ficus carica]GMN73827.1 hypothetical protein TIFTF001_054365 [Ficus carica]